MPGMCLNRSSVIGPDGIALADRGRYWGVALAALDLDRPRMVSCGAVRPVWRVSVKTPGTTAVPIPMRNFSNTGIGQMTRAESRLPGLLK